MPSINCLCIVQPPKKNSSWIRVTRLRLEKENEQLPRYDDIDIYLPSIIGIAPVRFIHELTNGEKNISRNYKSIGYHGMNSESENHESRALLLSKSWSIWNDRTKSFSKPLYFDDNNYFIIKFPLSYWREL